MQLWTRPGQAPGTGHEPDQIGLAQGVDESGALRKFVNVFVADDDVRFMDGLDTAVPDGETLSIIPAVAGG
mgnify:CR=1 FL=1